ncbi:MAG TPA: phosphodiesterase [Allosphingosinicella sp.]|jgi:3',5'-cyclic AMP phosphodiesterase CpdA|nr:phosphodiesterase [Allosphingosinicella sp.]
MLIAQITDVHLGFEPGNPDELNRRRLDCALRTLAAMVPRPDLLLATGDLADTGDDSESYARLKQAVADLPFPVFYALGNHDGRDAFRANFPDLAMPDGFLQYAIERHDLRILVLDTLDEGRHGGHYCETRAAWLRARLAEAPGRPTLLVLHHPPIESGHSWMTENPQAEWVKRLESIVAAHSNIVAIIAGHLHRPAVTRWAGTTLAVCPSTAPQVALDFQAIDPEVPDDRPMIVADPPWFAIHVWNGTTLVTHFDTAGDHEILARYGPKLQPLVRLLAAEKAET